LYNKITSKKKKKGGAKTMGIKKRKYSKEQKEEMVQKALSGKSILALGKENNISPGLINRWRRQYLKEGCRLMDIKRSTLYYRAKDNLNKKKKQILKKR
jgi:transposase-like protein